MQREPVDLSLNSKQSLLFRHIKGIVEGKSSKRIVFYGGAIRGGKTIGTLACLCYLATEYTGCKIIIIRDNLPIIKSTTLDSFNMVFPPCLIAKVNNSTMEYTMINGTRIQFFAESYQHDKDLGRFKGLECNFILLEQLEELQEETFNKAIERVGSYRLVDGTQPPGIILATFNPTQNWVKNRVYRPHITGTLPKSWLFISALPTDNPFVTEDQFNNWETMASITRKRFVEGDWEAVPTANTFAWAFKPYEHVRVVPKFLARDNKPYFVSFDFNVDPMCAIILSYADTERFHVIGELRIPNCDVIGICREILARYGRHVLQVTGDSNGMARNQGSKELGSHYSIIAREMGLRSNQIKVSKFNPKHTASQIIVNTVLEQHKDFAIHPDCKYLIDDLVSIRMTNMGRIDKADAKMGHLLDSFRYAINQWSSKIIKSYRINDFGAPEIGEFDEEEDDDYNDDRKPYRDGVDANFFS